MLSHCLSLSSCCAAYSSSRRAGWLLCASPLDVPPSRRLVVLSCRLLFCLVAPAGCHIIISRRPLIALPSSRPLIVLGTMTAKGSRATGGMTTATGGTTIARGGTATARGSRATGGTTTATGSTTTARGSRARQAARQRRRAARQRAARQRQGAAVRQAARRRQRKARRRQEAARRQAAR